MERKADWKAGQIPDGLIRTIEVALMRERIALPP
jgi:hypothetical protein